MKKKKILALLLAGSVAATVFAATGCGDPKSALRSAKF